MLPDAVDLVKELKKRFKKFKFISNDKLQHWKETDRGVLKF